MNKQPNSRFCFVCGVENQFGLHLTFYTLRHGEIQSEVIIPEQFQGYPGVVHGGIVAAMLDEVSGRAIMGEGSTRFMVTGKLSIRYRRPVPVGEKLILRGHVTRDSGRIAVTSGEIYNQEGQILAESEVVVTDIPNELRPNINKEDLGWKVYPDEEVPA